VEIRKHLGWEYGEFEIPSKVYDIFGAHAAQGAAAEKEWNMLWVEYQQKEPALAAQFERAVLEQKLPEGWADALPTYSPSEKGKATRVNSQECINGLASVLPEFMGGSADLASSTLTLMRTTGDFAKNQYASKNMRFGVREFGMGAIANAMSLSKTGMVPYCSTFLVFTDYMRHAIRMSAMSQAGTIFVMTHDSIALGEDGPTHQPVETIPSLRLIPDLVVMRPADGNETAGAYKIAVERSKLDSLPTLLCLSRQALPNLEKSSVDNVAKGAYPVLECDDPELILVATGSEVSLCMDAAKEMSDTKVRVVSMPSVEVFREQPKSYREELLPKEVPKLSVECAVTTGWAEWTNAHIGVNTFGASAPGGTCMDKFGFNVPNVVRCARRCLAGETGVLSERAPGRHNSSSRGLKRPVLTHQGSESKIRNEKESDAEEKEESDPLTGA
jgi:transketolase